MTDDKLKQALAKMLPELLEFYKHEQEPLWWETDALSASVLETELLHLCALVEHELAKDKWAWLPYINELNDICADDWLCYSIRATWQQRATALAKVKGIEV